MEKLNINKASLRTIARLNEALPTTPKVALHSDRIKQLQIEWALRDKEAFEF